MVSRKRKDTQGGKFLAVYKLSCVLSSAALNNAYCKLYMYQRWFVQAHLAWKPFCHTLILEQLVTIDLVQIHKQPQNNFSNIIAGEKKSLSKKSSIRECGRNEVTKPVADLSRGCRPILDLEASLVRTDTQHVNSFYLRKKEINFTPGYKK